MVDKDDLVTRSAIGSSSESGLVAQVNHHRNLQEARWYDRGDNKSSCNVERDGKKRTSMDIPVEARRRAGGWW